MSMRRSARPCARLLSEIGIDPNLLNEAQTRLELIDPAIRAAGWTKDNDCHVLVEQSACEFAPGRVGKVRGKPLRAALHPRFFRPPWPDILTSSLAANASNISKDTI